MKADLEVSRAFEGVGFFLSISREKAVAYKGWYLQTPAEWKSSVFLKGQLERMNAFSGLPLNEPIHQASFNFPFMLCNTIVKMLQRRLTSIAKTGKDLAASTHHVSIIVAKSGNEIFFFFACADHDDAKQNSARDCQ